MLPCTDTKATCQRSSTKRTRSSRKTSWKHQKILPRKILWPVCGSIIQKVGRVRWALCQRITNDNRLIRLTLQNPSEYVTAPDDAMQKHLVPKIRLPNSYGHIIALWNVFCRYLFAETTTCHGAKTVDKIKVNVLMKHCHHPTTTFCDMGSLFASQVKREIANVLRITLDCATTKLLQKVGMMERTDASFKKTSKIETCERRSFLKKYLIIVVLNYNTSNRRNNGCGPKRFFQGMFRMEKRHSSTKPYNNQSSDWLRCSRANWSNFWRYSAKMLCKLTSLTKYTFTKTHLPQNLERRIMSTSHRRNHITMEIVKLHSQSFHALFLTLWWNFFK